MSTPSYDVLGLGHQVEGPGGRVDDRGRRDADLGLDVRAPNVPGSSGGDAGRGIDEAVLPERARFARSASMA